MERKGESGIISKSSTPKNNKKMRILDCSRSGSADEQPFDKTDTFLYK